MAKYNTETFIAKLKEKFSDRFDYSKVEYIDSYHKITLICKEHNIEFECDPIAAIRPGHKGNFCKECRKNHPLSESEFLSKIQKYSKYYDLSNVKFKSTRDSITLICPNHGEFNIAARYVSSNGLNILCPKCKKQIEPNGRKAIELSEDAVFYEVLVKHKPTNTEFVKIGVSSKSTYQRYSGKKYKDFSFTILNEIFDCGENVLHIEAEYKIHNKHKRFFIPSYLNFSFHPTEIFIYDNDYQLKASSVELVRDGLLEKQNGLCPICGHEVTMPTLDHSHTKKNHGHGKVRGVLCNSCNRFVGVIENNAVRNAIELSTLPNTIRKLADYIEFNVYPLIHPSEASKRPKIKKTCYNKLVSAMKKAGDSRKIPKYTGNLSQSLSKLLVEYDIEPEYYGDK